MNKVFAYPIPSELEQLREADLQRSLDARRERGEGCFARGLCPQCGGNFGMLQVSFMLLLQYPPQPGESFYRDINDPSNADWVWSTCPTCNRDGSRTPNDFQEVSMEEVVEWLSVHSYDYIGE